MAAAAPISLQSLLPLARSLARKQNAQHVDDLMQEGLWAAHRAMARLRHARKPYALARAVMRGAMCAAMRKEYRQQELLVAHPPAAAWLPRFDDDLDLASYFADLEQTHGAEARVVAQNLMALEDPRCCEFFLSETRRRAHIQQRGVGKQQPLRLYAYHVRDGLGIPEGRWQALLTRIRGFTRAWLVSTGGHPAT